MPEIKRTAIVTGAARGIGRAIAQRMAAASWQVVIADVDGSAAAVTAEVLSGTGASVISQQVDVTDRSSIEHLVADTIASCGRIDVAVSNAGIMDRAPFLDMSEAFWHRVLDTNLTGTFLLGQAVARQMIAQREGGRIVNVASNSGVFGGRGRSAYGASKAGIINLTQTMAIELAEHDILVNAVAPGPIRTRDDQPEEPWPSVKARMPLARWGRPEEVAEVAFFLASEACSFTTGHVWCADGGYTVAGIMEG